MGGGGGGGRVYHSFGTKIKKALQTCQVFVCTAALRFTHWFVFSVAPEHKIDNNLTLVAIVLVLAV